MTSLLSPSTTSSPADTARSSREQRRDRGQPRTLVLLTIGGGLAAAAATLVVSLAVGVVGWFLTDAGGHGTPRDGLRVGALAWLMGHGSGVHVQGVPVTVMPLGITVVCAWATWRLGHRVGGLISGNGPDADGIADGQRDWTVPVASVLFTAGYAAVAILTASLAGTTATQPDVVRVVLWCVVFCGVLGAPALAIGSGRASIWAATVPASLSATAAACRGVLTSWLTVSLLFFLAALVTDFGTAVNVVSQLHTTAAATALIAVVCLLVTPNAVLFSGSYLLGPGFTVGLRTIVSPAQVSIGALPMFPLLAALPHNGSTSAWTPWLIAVPPVVAAVGVARAQRRHPTLRWEEGALHGCAGGMLAGFVFGALAELAGGAVGPGRMADVGPLAFSVLVHAITAFGIGGLCGGLVTTWWQRRRARRVAANASA